MSSFVSRLTAVAITAAVAAVPAVAAASTTSTAPPSRHWQPTASAAPGTTPLAAVLSADGDQFDKNWYDYDIVTQAVSTVLAAKPSSPVSVLTDGTTPVTAFLPNDRAFQVLAKDLTKSWKTTEQSTFDAVATLGVDTIEQVLLYHVVPGATITSAQAVKAGGTTLTTAQGATIGVRVWNRHLPLIELVDRDHDDVNPFLNPRALDLNQGNRQIAHGITFVLRPVNL